MEEHAHYSYDQKSRPDAETLIQLFQDLKVAPKKSEITLMGIARYSLSFPYTDEERHAILFAALDCLIDDGSLSMEYDPASHSAVLRFSDNYSSQAYDQVLPLLSYLKLKRLTIIRSTPLNLRNIADAQIHHIDLSQCAINRDTPSTVIRELLSVTLQEGHPEEQVFKEKLYRRAVRPEAKTSYEIIYKP